MKYLLAIATISVSAMSLVLALFCTRFKSDALELQIRLDEKESQLSDLYYEMGCGRLPSKQCEIEWRRIDQIAMEKHGIAPVACAERDAVVWVNPRHPPDEPDTWTFRCVPDKKP